MGYNWQAILLKLKANEGFLSWYARQIMLSLQETLEPLPMEKMEALQEPALRLLKVLENRDAGKAMIAIEDKNRQTLGFVYACRSPDIADVMASTIRRLEQDFKEMGSRTPNPYDLLDLIAQTLERVTAPDEPIDEHSLDLLCREIISIIKGNADGSTQTTQHKPNGHKNATTR